jgi:polyhydroxyalkanoate synthesis repressor PhaR
MRRDMNRKTVVIKKYENRRLYDTTNSRYINLDEVAQMVQDGYDVQVLDAATGEDLTRLVLTQIIAEHAKTPNSAFPLDVLRQMVAASGRATQESTLKYMKAVLDMYQNAYRAMAPPLSPFEFMRPPAARGAAAAPVGPSVHGEEAKGTEVDELTRRVEELEALVSKRRRKAKSRKRNSRRRS